MGFIFYYDFYFQQSFTEIFLYMKNKILEGLGVEEISIFRPASDKFLNFCSNPGLFNKLITMILIFIYLPQKSFF